jgi:hypothetical protein
MQMMCALLVFRSSDLPAPLAEVSPWLDWSVEATDVVRNRLASQTHRRIIKTHTPLDGLPLPLDPHVTYIVIGRHPLDVAVSLYHHSLNIDRERFAELSGKPSSMGPDAPMLDWMRSWIDADVPLDVQLDTLQGLVHHVTDAWQRQDQPNIVLSHYRDLTDGTDQQMRLLAERLDIDVPDALWPNLVHAASFNAMKSRASWLAPDRLGVLKDPNRFFRSGRSGDGTIMLSDTDLRRYADRISKLTSPQIIRWLHHGARPSQPDSSLS